MHQIGSAARGAASSRARSRRTGSALAVGGTLVAGLFGVAGVATAAPGDLTIVGSFASNFDLSADGTKIAFGGDLKVHDLVTGTDVLVATTADGTGADASAFDPSLSSDGTRISFASGASNLDPTANGGGLRIFVKDLVSGAVEAISKDAAGNGGAAGTRSAMSGNGQRVAFTSNSPLIASDTNDRQDVYVKDLTTGTLSIATGAIPPTGKDYTRFSSSLSMTDDGTKVLFEAEPRFNGGSTPRPDAFITDLTTGVTTRLVTPDDAGGGFPTVHQISGDGSHVAVAVSVPGTGVRIWVIDLATGTGVIASSADDGTVGTPGFGINAVAISDDGGRVAFTSEDTNLDPADTDTFRDIYVKDLATGDLQLASVTAGGVKADGGLANGNPGGASVPVLSGDGSRVGFVSNATNLGANPSSEFEFSLYLKELAPFGAGGVTDADHDGVADAVDSDGGAGTAAAGFADPVQGHPDTTGTIASGDVTVEDAPDPTKGVRITAITDSTISACGGFLLDIPAGGSVTLTCGSASVADITGAIVSVRTPNGQATVTFPAGTSGTVATSPSGSPVVSGVSGSGVTVTVGGVTTPITSGPPVTVILGASGNTTITGTPGNDVIVDLSGNNTIDGKAGDDVITTGPGNDKVTGGQGKDTFLAGAGNNVLDGGDGDDTFTAGAGNDTVEGGGGNDVVDVGSGNNVVNGGAGDDRVTTGNGNDTIDGGAGFDRCNAGGGTNKVKNCEG
jgi:Tol biopolymer transport system component